MAKTILEKAKEGFEEVVEAVEEAVEKVKEIVSGEDEKKVEKIKKNEETNKVNEKKKVEEMKIFDLYDISEVSVSDEGLRNVINLDYKLVIKSRGRNNSSHSKSNVNIIERVVNYLSVPGHRGKKHKIVTRWASGKYNKNMKVILEAFAIIEKRTGENPIQILVRAIENGAPRDEVTMIQYGGARYPQAVDCAPLRRVSLSIRNIVHGTYDKSFRSKKKLPTALAEELIATAKQESSSVAVNKKNELEKQADAAR
jgi:small subunit ribosomal protein S7